MSVTVPIGTTVRGRHVPDFPDLGAVTDGSKLFGWRSGTGLFNPSAVRDYVQAGMVRADRLAVNAADHGVTGDGVTNDFVALQAAANHATSIGSVLVLNGTVGRNIVVGTSLTFACATDFTVGAQLRANPGVELTLLGPIIAGSQHIFAGPGTFIMGAAAAARVMARWWGTVGDNATDNADAINRAIIAVHNSGGGVIHFSPGNYKVLAPIIMRGAVELEGEGRGNTMLQNQTNDANVVFFDTTCNYATIRGFFICGFTNFSATTNVVHVDKGVPVVIRDCNIWGGANAFFTEGVDGLMENCFVCGWNQVSGCCVRSRGANWYIRCKFDAAGSTPAFGFAQAPPYEGSLGVMENHLEQCDISGDFVVSVLISDDTGTNAVTIFSGCVFSSGISLIGHVFTSFIGCEFGHSGFNSPSGSVAVVGSFASVVTFVTAVQKSVVASFNIS